MPETFDWPWVETSVADTIESWNACAMRPVENVPRYAPDEQAGREHIYDQALQDVEREAKRRPLTRAQKLQTQNRIAASFARFATAALDLPDHAVQLLTNDFLPVGTKLARWARQFDEGLSMADIIQASRNAWTACGLQPLLGESLGLTPSILGYSLLYPYTDNFLDRTDISSEEKRTFGERFQLRLEGAGHVAGNHHEASLWALVELIERQYPRALHPQVYQCLLAIHRAQQESVGQLGCDGATLGDVLRMSCAKGGSSVLADACLARGEMDTDESRFAFEWGVLLQLGDDLQDVREDLERGSVTLFSHAAAAGVPLDGLTNQLLAFSDQVATRMDALPHGSEMLKDLLRMSWRSLIVGAVADSHQFFSPQFLSRIEASSPFRFEFLRARRKRLAIREGLYTMIFDAFLEAPEDDDLQMLPMPELAAV
jgi:hypothetical protein